MLPFGLQPIHLIVIAIVALLIFGPQRLPEIGRGVGRAINEFRKGAQEMTENLRDEVVKPGETATKPPESPAASGASQSCPQCGAQNAAGVRFCNHCGAQLVASPAPMPVQSAATQNCPQCGAQNAAGVRFCNQCGAQLVASPAPMPVQSAATQNCPQCGAQNPAGGRYCNQCGTQLPTNPA